MLLRQFLYEDASTLHKLIRVDLQLLNLSLQFAFSDGELRKLRLLGFDLVIYLLDFIP